jgi:putative transposase
VKFAFIHDNRDHFDVGVMCMTFGVTKAGFHAWLGRPESGRAARARDLCEQIRLVHDEVDGVYGSIKITKELRVRQHKVNRKTIARLMKRMGIRSKVSRKFRVKTTDSNHANPVAPNTLNRNFAGATGPDQIWGTDITYIHTDEGVLYLAGVMDLYSRRIVGWSMDDSMTTKLVEDAFIAALLTREPSSGLLHHSDRGVQYTSGRYRALLEAHGVEVSMSRTGNCY